ncbi:MULTISPECIES: mitochondrial fission ELM1 family protein [Dyella]|uniref:Nucleoside-diphosphate sugar epimerase n=2 Tax=Dyella TaxID=231454 RepID=A0A4R0YN40_9GAMM|nr:MULTISPECIES: mitochondrial fission ELM1 family protein [Dyella]TBR36316.1 nucleoside-diphosphate sugar epimerase [Dyella terrae]TCI05973.1 nucleoside-diphosphate sugar epimerase [Dyella soli]
MKLHGNAWVITDGNAGNDRQALALAESLGLPFRHMVLSARPPWSWLSPRLIFGGRLALPAAERQGSLEPPWPAVAIGCGRLSALYTRMLRDLSEHSTYTIQILDPRMNPSAWDTVIAPRHDRCQGQNVLQTVGSLNLVDDAWLQEGREVCPEFAEYPQPRIGVLVGGPRKGIPLDADYATQLADRLRDDIQREGGSVMLVTSRRTPPQVLAVLRERLAGVPGMVWGGDDHEGINPYPGVLGWSDRLVVTPDSVNMLSEACAVGCPVQTFAPQPLPDKIFRFHRALREAGLLYDLADDDLPKRQVPLRELAPVVEVLRGRIDEHQWKRGGVG